VKRSTRRKVQLIGAGIGAGIAAGLAVRRLRTESIEGQIVLITGGSRGLGLALAREFSRNGCRIAICARDEAELNKAKNILEQEGTDVFAFPCDVSDQGSVTRLVEAVRSHFGRIDILVNNAGVISVAPLDNLTVADFERAMAVMFWGVVYPTLAILPDMKNRHYGRIANITSIGGKVSVPHLLPYSCAKFAAVGFSEGLRAEAAPYGISVTTIAPGLMRTGSHLKAEFKGQRSKEMAWFGVAATSPVTSMSAERAARQIVAAIRRGDAEKILTTQANLLARIHGSFPGLMPNLMALVNRMLPAAGGIGESAARGEEIGITKDNWFQTATALGRKAAERLNQNPEPAPASR